MILQSDNGLNECVLTCNLATLIAHEPLLDLFPGTGCLTGCTLEQVICKAVKVAVASSNEVEVILNGDNTIVKWSLPECKIRANGFQQRHADARQTLKAKDCAGDVVAHIVNTNEHLNRMIAKQL